MCVCMYIRIQSRHSKIDEASSPLPASPANLVLPSLTDVPAAVSPGRTSVMEVEVAVPQGVSHIMGIVITGAPEDVSVCSAHVIFVGDLMPCLNGSRASTQPLR